MKSQQITELKVDSNPKVIHYLLDTSRHLSDDEQYQLSLFLEPRLSKFSNRSSIINFPQTISPTHYKLDEKEGKNEKK